MFLIIQHCDMSTLFAIMQTSRSSNDIVKAELRLCWKQYLGQWFSKPSHIINSMRCTGTVVSGSSALHWLDRGSQWTPNDIDFYCPYDTFELFVRQIKMLEPGLLENNKQSHAIFAHTTYNSSNGFCDRISLYQGNRKYDVIRSRTMSPCFPLVYFHSTIVMNYVGADNFSIAYPALTLQRKGVKHSRDVGASDRRALAKYKSRGYTVVDSFAVCNSHRDYTKHRRDFCSAAVRNFSDNNCLSVSFNRPPWVQQLNPTEWTTGWVLGGSACGGYCLLRACFTAFGTQSLGKCT